MIRVLIADDHAFFREGLRHILESAGGLEVVGDADDAASTLDLARRVEADVLVLDMSMPGRSGIELIARIRGEVPSLKILVLTMHAEDQYALRAFKAGAVGYLTKEAAARELEIALRKIASGGTYVTSSLAELFAQDLGRPVEPLPHQRLSEREFSIFLRFAEGQTFAQIADELRISTRTVSTYKARILERMNLPNEAALVRYAIRHDLLRDSSGGH